MGSSEQIRHFPKKARHASPLRANDREKLKQGRLMSRPLHILSVGSQFSASAGLIFRQLPKIHTQHAQLAIQMGTLHADTLGQLSYLAIA